jgi:hypothetical protein
MQALRLIPRMAAAMALLIPAVASGSAGAHLSKPCAVPSAWRLVARDRHVVVIAQRHEQFPAYDYCNGAVGRWRRMLPLPPAPGPQEQEPVGLQLAGRFVAAWVPAVTATVLWDTRTAQRNIDAPGFVESTPLLALSPKGVLATILTLANTSSHSEDSALQVVTPTSFEELDTAAAGGLSNLQLYDCSARCAPNAVTVAWTDNGQQRYAQVTGS